MSPDSTLAVPGEGLDRVDICVARVNGRYYALSNVCTHKGGPMNEGTVTEKNLICPWHKAYFRLDSGRNFFPADRPLRTFEVKVQDGSIYIKIPDRQRVKERARPSGSRHLNSAEQTRNGKEGQ